GVAVLARREQRVVPVGEGARGAVGGEVGAQPVFLGRPCAHLDVAVERDDVPAGEVVAVVAQPRVAREPAEVVVVGSALIGVVVVVARCGPGASLVPAPGGIVAARELLGGAGRVGVVPGGEHGARDVVEQGGGGRVGGFAAVGDVARADEHGGGGRARG